MVKTIIILIFYVYSVYAASNAIIIEKVHLNMFSSCGASFYTTIDKNGNLYAGDNSGGDLPFIGVRSDKTSKVFIDSIISLSKKIISSCEECKTKKIGWTYEIEIQFNKDQKKIFTTSFCDAYKCSLLNKLVAVLFCNYQNKEYDYNVPAIEAEPNEINNFGECTPGNYNKNEHYLETAEECEKYRDSINRLRDSISNKEKLILENNLKELK
jgi:hypothetical protein